MSAASLESFLARLYADESLRQAFLANPDEVMSAQGLDELEVEALKHIDRAGLEFAARSFAHKRAAHAPTRHRRSWLFGFLDSVRRIRD